MVAFDDLHTSRTVNDNVFDESPDRRARDHKSKGTKPRRTRCSAISWARDTVRDGGHGRRVIRRARWTASVAPFVFCTSRPPRSSGCWRRPGCSGWSGWPERSTGTRSTGRPFCCCWWPRSRWSPTGWRASGTRSATRSAGTWTAKWAGWTYWPTTRTSSTRTTTPADRA